MKKNRRFSLGSLVEIKIFLLFLLDNIKYPIDYTTLSKILLENVEVMTFDYEQCLGELAEDGHLLFDEIDGEKYYMISDSGRGAAAELYDTIDKDFRESSVRVAEKYISLSRTGAEIYASVEQTEDKRYKVTLGAKDTRGEVFGLTLVVSTRSEAERIKGKFEEKPDSFYRGVMFCATGNLELL